MTFRAASNSFYAPKHFHFQNCVCVNHALLNSILLSDVTSVVVILRDIIAILACTLTYNGCPQNHKVA
jgi:hypothetical protein